MTSEDQAVLKRRLRDAELMPAIIRLEGSTDLELVQAVITWDDLDVSFAQSTRLGRRLVDRFNAIDPAQIDQWASEGSLWE